jgi:hypothetical protein
MLETGVALALIMTAFEIYAITRLRPERWDPETEWWMAKPLYKLGPWIERSPLRSLVFSLGLSFVLGLLFAPGANLAVLIGGVLSTILVQPYYGLRRLAPKIREQVIDVASTVRGTARKALPSPTDEPTRVRRISSPIRWFRERH